MAKNKKMTRHLSSKVDSQDGDSDDSMEDDIQKKISNQFSSILQENKADPKIKEEKLAEFIQRDLKTDCGHVLFKL